MRSIRTSRVASGLWIIVVMIGVGMVTGVLLFTAEGAPSAPYVTPGTSLSPSSGAQVFSWTASVTVMGTQPINSIDEQGAYYTYSVFQNGHPITVNQRVALAVTGQSGVTFTMQAQPSVGLPALCPVALCGSIIENVSILSSAVVPGWTGVYVSPSTNVTFSTVPSFTTVQKVPGTPSGVFVLNSLGVIAAGVAIILTLTGAFFQKGNWMIWLGAGASWLLFAGTFALAHSGA